MKVTMINSTFTFLIMYENGIPLFKSINLRYSGKYINTLQKDSITITTERNNLLNGCEPIIKL